MTFVEELKRRNVIKVAVAYMVVAWLVMQFSDVILNNIEAPGWVFQVIMLVLGIGFALALFFAWAFEMTPEGIKREHEVDRSQSITQQTGRKLDFLVIGVMSVALAYFIWESRFSEPTAAATSERAGISQNTNLASNEPADIPDKNSIAVLPFAQRMLGNEDAAVARFDATIDLIANAARSGTNTDAFEFIFQAPALAGRDRFDEAIAAADRAVEIMQSTGDAIFTANMRVIRALVLGMAGNREESLAELEILFKEGVNISPWRLYLDPNWDFFRDDERFNELARPLNLEEARQ